MTKLITISGLAKLTAVLAASAALMSSAVIASAKSDHHQGNNVKAPAPALTS
jgi:hypothetical protein